MPKSKEINKSKASGNKPRRFTNRITRTLRLGGGLLFVVVLAIGGYLWTKSDNPFHGEPGGTDVTPYKFRETKKVFSSERFTGKVARAYWVAEQIPHVIDQIYCWCECDKYSGHKSLLSCFTSLHASG
ncbi:MAG: hypothetical protein JRI22_13105 [Deltaproteobacteria bacterium]|nr:hypothetical protein [Deltaproteobacteria bacterium]